MQMQTTKRYPRTMEEAFGPGHRGQIHEPYPEMDTEDKVIVAIGVIGLVVVLTCILFGVI